MVDTAVEVEWSTFSGVYNEIFQGLFIGKFDAERPNMDKAEYFRLLIERGVRELHRTPDIMKLVQRGGETNSKS